MRTTRKYQRQKSWQMLRGFALDLTATQTTELTDLNRNTVDRLYAKMRARVAEYHRPEDLSIGEFEVDESYFGPRRVKRPAIKSQANEGGKIG